MLKKTLAIALAAALALGMSACGGNNDKDTSGDNKGESKTLNLWHYWDSEGQQVLLADMVKAYKEDTNGPEIKISYIPYSEYIQKILVTAAGGQLPELFIYDGNSTATFVEADILADITDRIEASGIMKDTLPGVVDEHKVGGKLYGFPVYANCVALFYRTDLIDTPPTTWDELYETAKSVSKDGMYGFAMAGGGGEDAVFQFLPFMWSAGEDLDNVAAPGTVEALDLISGMIKEGIMSADTVNNSQEDTRVLFETGRAAMMLNGPWNVVPLQENAPNMEWDLAMIPKKADGEFASILGGESFGIGKDTDIDAIWDFVEYLVEPERYKEFLKGLGQLPADSVLGSDPYYTDDPVNKVFIEQLKSARPRAYGGKYNEMSKALQTALSSAMSGDQSAQDALNDAAATITPLYEEFKASEGASE